MSVAEVHTHKDCGGTVIWDLSGGFCTRCHAEGLEPEDTERSDEETP